MKSSVVRATLAILLAFVAVFDIVYSIVVLTGAIQLSPGEFQGTLFSDATVPMLLLAILVGGSSLLAIATVFIRREWSTFLVATAGLIMIAWEVAEIAIFQQFSWLEALFIAIGLMVIGLASYLWTTEFRGTHFPIRHIGHA